MSITFLDEGEAEVVPVAGAGGVTFIDEEATAVGVTFEDEGAPAALPDLQRRLGDLNYLPSKAEFQRYRELKADEPAFQPGKWASIAGEAAGMVAKDLGKGVLKLPKLIGEEQDTLQTGGEALARGTYDLGMMMRPLVNKAKSLYADEGEAAFIARKVAELNTQAFPKGVDASTTLLQPKDLTPELREQFGQEYQEYKKGRDYDRFVTERQLQLVRQLAREGKSNLLPELLGKTQNEVAEAGSYFLDPTTVVGAGAAALGKKTPTVLQQAAAKAATSSGRALEATGEAVSAAARLPEQAAGKVAALVSTPEAAAQAEKVVRQGSLGLTGAIPVVSVPGLTETAAAITAGKAAGATAQGVGKAGQAVGRAVADGPTRVGLFERIAKDGMAPEWLRKTAKALEFTDPAVRAAGNVSGDAVRGGAVGAAIGGLATGDLEGAASGFGSGLVMRPVGGLIGRVNGRQRIATEEADLARWLGRKSAEEVDNIGKLALSREEALKLADLESLAKGVVDPVLGGDVEFRYVTDADFRKQFGEARGAQVVEGDKPVVVVNTGYKGPRSVFHETAHALYQLDAAQTQQAALQRMLFDQVDVDGNVLTKGVLGVDDVTAMEQQYRNRLTPEQRALWDIETPEQRRAKIREEIVAESFANLLARPGTVREVSSLKQRLVDSLLMASQDGMLGRMRSALEKAGVKFEADGTPSDIFTRNGEGITNSAQVNAALRDYLRAKAKLTERLLVNGDERPEIVVRPEDLVKPGNAPVVAVFKDADIFAKNPDGTVRRIGGDPQKLQQIQKELNDLRSRLRASDEAVQQAKAAEAQAQTNLQTLEATLKQQQEKAHKTQDRVALAESKLLRERAKQERQRIQQLNREARERERVAKQERAQAVAKEKQLKAEEKQAEGQPVLLTEKQIEAVQAQRVEQMMAGLLRQGDDGTPGALRLKENGAWEGGFMTERQLAVMEQLPDGVLSPGMKEKLREINTLMQRKDGSRLLLDYNAALKGNRYSSGIAASTRVAVPLSMHMSKAGNFYITTLDVTHFHRKLGDWGRNKKGFFKSWDGDLNSFTRDVFQYLDNHAQQRPGSYNLDSDPAQAVQKRNLINQFFGVTAEGVNPLFSESAKAKENLLRSRRFDRINRAQEADGQKMPVDYTKLKMNLLPAIEARDLRSQTVQAAKDVRAVEFIEGLKLPASVGKSGFETLWQSLMSAKWLEGSEREKALVVAQLLGGVTPADYQRLREATLTGGTNALKSETEALAQSLRLRLVGSKTQQRAQHVG